MSEGWFPRTKEIAIKPFRGARCFLWCVLLLATLAGPAFAADGDKVKIGYIVPDATDNWWLRQWFGATVAARDHGFALLKSEAHDAEKIRSTLEKYAADGVQGVLIGVPEVKMGPEVIRWCREYGMKLYSISNQFVNPDGRPIEEVPYSGAAGYAIGRQMANAMYEEAFRREWRSRDTGMMLLTVADLPAAVDRLWGCVDEFVQRGASEDMFHDSPVHSRDAIGAFAAATKTLADHPGVKNWFVAASNDPIAVGAVRALEAKGFKPGNVIAVGVNGGQEARNEFTAPHATGFFASVYLPGTTKGYEDALRMLRWIKKGVPPPPGVRITGTLITRENFQEYPE